MYTRIKNFLKDLFIKLLGFARKFFAYTWKYIKKLWSQLAYLYSFFYSFLVKGLGFIRKVSLGIWKYVKRLFYQMIIGHRIVYSFLMFVVKWIVPFGVVVFLVFSASFYLVTLIPPNLQNNQLLTTLIPAVISFCTLKLIEAYLFILDKKSKHMKRVALTLAELNKINQINYRNNELLKYKLPALQTVLRNILDIKENGLKTASQNVGNICSDPLEGFINLSEESKSELLNVDLINTIESLLLQIESNNKNVNNLNIRDIKVISLLDDFLHRLNLNQLKPSDYSLIEMSLKNLIGMMHNFRRELKRTHYYSLFLTTKLAISEKEDPISFDIWVITRYLADFNRQYSYSSLKRQFLRTISKQFRLKSFEIKTALKITKKELDRISDLTDN